MMVEWKDVNSAEKFKILMDLSANIPRGKKQMGTHQIAKYLKEKYEIEANPDTLRGALSKFRKANGEQTFLPKLNDLYPNRFLDYPKISGNYVVTSDWHIPFCDYDLVNAMCMISVKMNVNKLIIAGDFFDGYLYSIFPKETESIVSEVEFNAAEKILEMLLDYFQEIEILMGSHDQRLLLLLENKMTVSRMFKMVSNQIGKKIKISRFPYLHLNDSWRVSHPRNYAQTRLSVAEKLCTKYRMNIISAHGHSFGLTFDRSGRNIIADSGGLFDLSKLEYLMLSDKVNPTHCEGFFVIVDNLPYPFAPGITNWSRDWGIEYRGEEWKRDVGVIKW